MKKKNPKNMQVLVVFGMILLITIGIFIVVLVQKYTPSKERADLAEYYNISSDDQVAIVLDNELSDSYATLIDGSVYLDFHFVQDEINSRFYWDENENILLYTTADDLIQANADESSYLVTKSSVDNGKPVVKASADSAWIDIDFVKNYSDIDYTYYEDPARIVLTSKWGDIETATAKKNTYIREKGGIKSPILADVEKNANLTVLAVDEKWTKVQTEDGIIGYIRSNTLSGTKTMTLESDFIPETYSHILKDYEICMAWHQVTSKSANDNIASVLSGTKGVNVISPTWFYLNDNNGNIANLASNDYVTYCHQHNVEVWALVSNLENTDVDTTYVLTHTSIRQNLVNQIVSAAIQYNLDGINLDFEALDGSGVGDSYIQFVRELSLKCANNGIVLSVDNYVPSSYTAFYDRAEQALFADYVVIMGYDEHYAGSDEAGSVASLNWVTEAVENTLAEVPSEQIILGMPFYTRVWCQTPDNDASDTEIIYSLTSQAYGMTSAANLVSSNNAEKVWLDDCGQFYAEFESDGSTYMVWLEDSSSAEERLRLLDTYSLAGASFWKLGFESSDIWDTVIKYIN
jgi:spore germination protein YaaH